MTEQPASPTQSEPAQKPSPVAGYVWIFAGIAGIALLLAMSLFIAGL